MRNSDDNVLSLPPLTPDFGFEPQPTQLATRDSSNAIEGLQAINEHTWRQKFLIDSIAGRARQGVRRTLELDQYAASMFHETAEAILKINEAAHGSAYEAYHTAFNDRMVRTAARHTLGFVEVGARSIADEVARRPQPPAPKTFLQRFFS